MNNASMDGEGRETLDAKAEHHMRRRLEVSRQRQQPRHPRLSDEDLLTTLKSELSKTTKTPKIVDNNQDTQDCQMKIS